MITIASNQSMEINAKSMSFDDPNTESFFDNYPYGQFGFSEDEQEILKQMIIQKKSRRRQSKRLSNSSAKHSDSGTAATELESPYLMGVDDATSAASTHNASAASVSGSVEPVKRRLSIEEEAAFMMGENTGEFLGNDSFGSLDENSSDFSSLYKVYKKASSSTYGSLNRRGLMSRGFSSGSIETSSRRSLYSVEEGMEVASPVQATQKNDHLSTELNIKSSKRKSKRKSRKKDKVSDETSLDSISMYDAHSVSSGLYSAKEKKLKKKMSSRSLQSSSSDTPKGANVVTAEAFLARLSAKQEEWEAGEMKRQDSQKFSKSAPSELGESEGGSFSLAGAPCSRLDTESPSISLPVKGDQPRSMSCIPSPTRNLYGETLVLEMGKVERMLEKGTDERKPPRRPSLHTVFEWSREPSSSNLYASDDDPPADDDNSTVISVSCVPDRRKLLRKSYSTTDINQYNKTPHWPPSARRQSLGGLHAQFYRRATNLPTPSVVSRSNDSSPIVSAKQMLDIMEPVTVRELLTFSGLMEGRTKSNSRVVNYGDVLDTQSLSSRSESKSPHRVRRVDLSRR
jgi:hypothetical protein